MIKVFDGNWRGLGNNSKQSGAIFSFEFRDYLHHFKGANLHVFMSICLHVDKDGFCYPSYDTIQRETGYGRGTVAKSIAELCEMKIDGHAVLMRWRERGDDGRYTGSNRYRIFPTLDEIEELNIQSSVSSTVDQSSVLPQYEKSNSGQSELEDKPVFKDKPLNESIAVDKQQPEPKRKRESKAYVNPDTKVSTTDILQAYEKAMEHAEPGAVINYGQSSKSAKDLAAAGWTAQDVTTCFWKMKKDEFWRGKHLPLTNVAKQIGAMMGNGRKSPPANVVVASTAQPTRRRMKVLN